jgi:hypothetical protein
MTRRAGKQRGKWDQGGSAGDQEGARGEVHENVGKQKGKVMDAQEELEEVDENSASPSAQAGFVQDGDAVQEQWEASMEYQLTA